MTLRELLDVAADHVALIDANGKAIVSVDADAVDVHDGILSKCLLDAKVRYVTSGDNQLEVSIVVQKEEQDVR